MARLRSYVVTARRLPAGADRRRRRAATASAHRFDTSPAWLSRVGEQPALELLHRIGVGAVYDLDVALANRFRAGLGLDPPDSAIVSVEIADAALAALAARSARA